MRLLTAHMHNAGTDNHYAQCSYWPVICTMYLLTAHMHNVLTNSPCAQCTDSPYAQWTYWQHSPYHNCKRLSFSPSVHPWISREEREGGWMNNQQGLPSLKYGLCWWQMDRQNIKFEIQVYNDAGGPAKQFSEGKGQKFWPLVIIH
jgi:hypothetical protein